MIAAPLEVDLLRCFVAVSDLGGFTKAGQRIGLTQSGVSVKIRRLEDRVGARVLIRGRQRLALTPEGELLISYARRILELHDEVAARLDGTRASGTLRVGVEDFFVPNLVPSLLDKFSRRFPKVRLEIRAGVGMELIPLFDRGELDLVLTGSEGRSDWTKIMHTEPLGWVASEDFRFQSDHSLPLVMFPSPCSFRGAGIEALERAGIEWHVAYTGTSIPSLQNAVRAGLGVGVLPWSALGPGLRALGPADLGGTFPELPEVSIALFAGELSEHSLLEVFVDYLEQELRTSSFDGPELTGYQPGAAAPLGH